MNHRVMKKTKTSRYGNGCAGFDGKLSRPKQRTGGIDGLSTTDQQPSQQITLIQKKYIKKLFLPLPALSTDLRNSSQTSPACDHVRKIGHFRASASRLALLGIAAILAIASCGETSPQPLTSLEYSAAPLNAELGVEIPDMAPTLAPDGASGTYSVSPPLPEGLSLHETSGVISGTPTVLYDSTVHTVTVKGSDAYSGTVTANITVEVFSVPVAAEIPKRAPADVRDSYVLFSVSSDQLKTDYHLAVKEASEPAPTAAEMSSGALKRNIGTDAINVLIAQRLNAPMIDFARAYFADNSQTNLGAGMTSANLQNDFGIIFDDTAVGADALVAESVLKPSTQYALYGMDNGGTRVAKLLTAATDSTLDPPTDTANDILKLVDTTLEAGYIEIAVNADEYYIFPHQTELNPTLPVSRISFHSSAENTGSNLFLMQNKSVFGAPDSGYKGSLYLLKTVGTGLLETMKKGCYVLLSTGRHWNESIPEQRQYGATIIFDTLDITNTLHYSVLRRQL